MSRNNNLRNAQQNNNMNEQPLNLNDGSVNKVAPNNDGTNKNIDNPNVDNNQNKPNNDIKSNNADPSKVKPSSSNPSQNIEDASDEAKEGVDKAKEGADKAKEAASNAGGESGPGATAATAKNIKDTAQTAGNEMKSFAENAGDLYAEQEDGVTGTVEDMKEATVGTAKAGADAAMAIGKAYAGDGAGAAKSATDAVKEVVKIIPSILRLLLPLVLISIMIISLFLQSAAMIWQGIVQSYEEWAYSKAVMAIDAGIDDAAFNVVDGISDDINDFLGDSDFKTKCNQYYFDYLGNGYTRDYNDGTSLSIELEPSSDGQHEDAYITYINSEGATNTIVYRNADVTYDELDTDVSYSQIISAFNLYREKKAKEDGSYKVFHTFNKEINDAISKLRDEMFEKLISRGDFLSDTENLLNEDSNDKDAQPLGNITSLDKTNSRAVWGLADTGALYYYMTHDENLSKALYDYTITNESGTEISDVSSDKADTSTGSNSYKIIIDVTSFDSNDRQSKDGTNYSSDIMKGFGITSEEDIEKVVNNANLSNILLNVATTSNSDSAKEFEEFISFSQPKILFEKIIGGPSVIEKMIDAGLYSDWSEDSIRRLMASYASAWVNRTQAVSSTDETFFFRTKDEFTDAFTGTSAGWEYDSSSGTYKQSNSVTFDSGDAAKYLGEDGMFMTYLYAKTLNAGMLQDEAGNPLKPRTYIFPENYPDDPKKKISQLYSSQDYYYYFQQYGLNGSNTKSVSGDTAWYQLSDFLKGANTDAWDNAFNKDSIEDSNQHTSCIEKGDLIFLTYFNAAAFDVDSLKDIVNGNFTPFYGNKGYQVGIVTDVDYSAKTLKFVTYNYDDDPIKESFVESTFDSTVQRYLGTSGLKVTEITISYDGNGEGTISPEWDDVVTNSLSKINNVLKTIDEDAVWEPNPLTFITGYGKPNYSAYADEINKRMEAYREAQAKSLAEAAMDLGGGTLGYPLEENKRNISQDYGHNGHAGIDYSVSIGTPVYAADDGVITKSQAITSGGTAGRGTPARAPNGKLYRSYGEVIEIYHSDSSLTTYYAHLSKRLVNSGDTVERGQLIGYSGNTGNSSGPHLHFEVRKNGSVVNPHDYLTDTESKKLGKYTYEMNTYITKSPVNDGKINVTFYCPGSCCNGSNAGTTAMGFKISNTHKYYDKNQAYVACNWLPLGTKIRIDFGDSSSMGWFKNENLVYTVVDTGSASRLSAATIDVLVPSDHSKTNIGKGGGKDYVKIKILSLGKKPVNV